MLEAVKFLCSNCYVIEHFMVGWYNLAGEFLNFYMQAMPLQRIRLQLQKDRVIERVKKRFTLLK